MSSTVWRIATDTPLYVADDLTGAGAKVTGGRWNEAGFPLLYTSETRALASLETIVHLGAGTLPLNRYLVEISVPEKIWKRADRFDAASLPVGWDAEPAGRESIAFGTDWITAGSAALLILPSVIVPEERNILINPAHPDAASIKAKKIRKWLYDARLVKAS